MKMEIKLYRMPSTNELQYEENTSNVTHVQESKVAFSEINQAFLWEFAENFSTYQTGDEFFNSLVQFISDHTQLHYVFLGELVEPDPGQLYIKTFALNAFGNKADNFQYGLPDGPCEQVIMGKLYSYPSNCQQTFPKNKTIAQFNVDGYLGYPLYDVKGNAFGIIVTMHEKPIEDADNISMLLRIVAKRAEFEFERIKHEKILTAAIKDLENKNNELERKNAELASFTYIASHDLQEPLRKITSFTSRILDKDTQNISPSSKDYFNRIQNASVRAQRLINDLLLYSQTNKNDKPFETLKLNKIVDSVIAEMMETIAANQVEISTSDLPELNVIGFQFHQLFTNLIGNALKFRKTGITSQIKITCSIISGDELNDNHTHEGSYYMICVSDNGIGFNNLYGEKIFSVFQRLHAKEDYEGTGIGLTICRKIAENHGGFMSADGKEDEGATFCIYLPTS